MQWLAEVHADTLWVEDGDGVAQPLGGAEPEPLAQLDALAVRRGDWEELDDGKGGVPLSEALPL